MSRSSRVSYFQNVYDLFDVLRSETLDEPAAQIADWERRTGHPFPSTMKEFYTTAVVLRTGGRQPQDWRLTLPDLWTEFSNDERAQSLAEVLEYFTPPAWLALENTPTQSFAIIWENQGCWVMCARDDGTSDPSVDVSASCFLSPGEMWESEAEEWHSLGPFSEVVISWLAHYYVEDFTPISYEHGSYRTGLKPEDAPPRPYRNGLWLRSPAEPFTPPILDYLTENLCEPERTARPGDVTTYTFSPDGGIIRVTADDQAHPEALSAWWVYAETPERLAEFGRLLLPWGTLRETLRADTNPAREVWNATLQRI